MSQRITIIIETGNSAFEDAPDSEVARILRAMADRIEETGEPPRPCDANGNRCGSVSVEQLEE